MLTTKVFEVLPGRAPRLMNTITFSSRFKTVPLGPILKQIEAKTGEKISADDAMGREVVQVAVAKSLIHGWRHNGNKPEATYEIEVTH